MFGFDKQIQTALVCKPVLCTGFQIRFYPKKIIELLKLVFTSLVNFRSLIVKMKSFLMLIVLVAVTVEVFGAKPAQRGGRNEKGKLLNISF